MIYTISYYLSPLDGDEIINDILVIEAISSTQAIEDAIKLLDEEYPGSIVLEIECIEVNEND